ncbi:hypothetical protein [Amycolatopsis sp. NBC_01480]|uniref:hypothetical protein n=1 Tax=Amycolatopsis sp. NBC_01480 TaxID=2903562 RepID=UPI002E2DF403|nr:hypothetical protein [Amycolatopsis sp. NBC_01480]
MPQTSTWALPYPAGTQVPNVPADLQALATATDAALSAATAFVGGEVRANALQNLSPGGNALSFPTVVVSPAGVAWDGSTTWTVQQSAPYSLFANARIDNVTGSPAIHFAGTTYSDGTFILPGLSTSSGYGDVSTSGTVYLTAGTQVRAWIYTGTAAKTAFAIRPPMFKIWRK